MLQTQVKRKKPVLTEEDGEPDIVYINDFVTPKAQSINTIKLKTKNNSKQTLKQNNYMMKPVL